MKEINKKEEVTEKKVVGYKDVTKYEAIDGTIFNYKYECEEYELDCLWNKIRLTKKVIYNSFDDNAYYLCNNFDELNALFYRVGEITLDKHYDKTALEYIKSNEVFPQYFAIEEYNNAGYAVSYGIKTPKDKIKELSIELEGCAKHYNEAIDGLKEIDLAGEIHLVSDEKKL